MSTNSDLLDVKEASALLVKLNPKNAPTAAQLVRWRRQEGPRVTWQGGRPLYQASDLEAYAKDPKTAPKNEPEKAPTPHPGGRKRGTALRAVKAMDPEPAPAILDAALSLRILANREKTRATKGSALIQQLRNLADEIEKLIT